MLRKKTGQLHTETPNTSESADVAMTTMRKQLKRKGLMALAALLLLVTVAIIGTMAWYTRISNVTGMTMDVAKFDFNANYTGSDDVFTINVGGYLTSTLAQGKAAPGSKGVIPIRMSSGDSDTGVSYSLNLDFAEMADEFQDRLRFYYYTSENGGTLHVIDPATATETSSAIIGSLAASGEDGDKKYEYIYWEWVYELDDDWFAQDGKWYQGSETYTIGGTSMTGSAYFDTLYPETADENADPPQITLQAATEAFDEFDTKIGLGKCDAQIDCHYAGDAKTVEAEEDAATEEIILKAYQVAMKLKLHVTGAQAEPVPNGGTSPITGGTAGTAVYKANG